MKKMNLFTKRKWKIANVACLFILWSIQSLQSECVFLALIFGWWNPTPPLPPRLIAVRNKKMHRPPMCVTVLSPLWPGFPSFLSSTDRLRLCLGHYLPAAQAGVRQQRPFCCSAESGAVRRCQFIRDRTSVPRLYITLEYPTQCLREETGQVRGWESPVISNVYDKTEEFSFWKGTE